MPPSIRLAGLVPLIVAALLGCADAPAPEIPYAPDLNFTNGPTLPGPVVFRVAGWESFVFLIFDEEQQLTASVALTDRFSDFCNSLVDVAPADLQLLFLPNGRLHLLYTGKELPLILYQGGAEADPCTILATAPILGRGTVDLRFIHHDLNSVAPFGYQAQGRVDLSDGTAAHFDGKVKFTVDGEGDLVARVSRIGLGAPK